MKSIFIYLLLFGTFISNMFGQKTFYVNSKTGNDSQKWESCDGTLKTIRGVHDLIWKQYKSSVNSKNVITVDQTINIILQKTTENIKLGYSDTVPITKRKELIWHVSGSPSFPIVIRSEDPNNRVTIERNFPENDPKWWAMIDFNNVSYITVRDIIFQDASTALLLSNSTHHCSIVNCKFITNDFYVNGGGGSILLYGRQPYSGPPNHPLEYCSYNLIEGNHIEFNELSVFDIGFSFEKLSTESERNLYHNFSLYHGIYVSEGSNDNIIRKNEIKNAPGGGIHICHNYIDSNKIDSNDVYLCYSRQDYHLKSQFVNEDPNYYREGSYHINYSRWGIILQSDGDALFSTITNNEINDNNLYASKFIVEDIYPDSNRLLFVDNLLKGNNPDIKPGGNSYDSTIFKCNINDLGSYTTNSNYITRFEKRYASKKNIRIFNFPNRNEIFIAINDSISNTSKLLKVAQTGGGGSNMLNTSYNINNSGEYLISEYLIGTEYFSGTLIGDIEFAQGNTIIGFSNGYVLKINGTGGTGTHMFNIKMSGSNYEDYDTNCTHYLLGQQHYDYGINDIYYVNHDGYNNLFLCFGNGSIHKIIESGGRGYKMFEPYTIGNDKFNAKISIIKYYEGVTFLCFENNKVLKVSGIGGTGNTMFNVIESDYDFMHNTQYPNCHYYVGHSYFKGKVTYMLTNSDGQILFCFDNGKILKTTIGGEGANMFAISEPITEEFIGLTGYSYYIGYIRYDGYVTSGIFDSATNKTVLGFSDGKVRIIKNFDGTGSYVFEGHTLGWEIFHSRILDIDFVKEQNVLFITMMDGKILKLNGLGLPSVTEPSARGTEFIFGMYQTLNEGFHPDIVENTYLGWQDLNFDLYPNLKSAQIESGQIFNSLSKSDNSNSIILYPNPSDGIFNIQTSEKIKSIEVFNNLGLKISPFNSDDNYKINMTAQNKGIYFIKITTDNCTEVKQIILK